MAERVIDIGLGTKSIRSAIKQLEFYRDSLEVKMDWMLEELALIGVREASFRFTTALYDGVNDTDVSMEPIDGGYCIKAKGHAVFFIEFGSGVYHNPSEPYPDPRPKGVVGIGEYGKGYGKRPAWGYKNGDGEVVITRGNPAAMPMWYASEEMQNAILQKFKEVFGK